MLLFFNLMAPLVASLGMAFFRLQKIYTGSYQEWTSIMSSMGFAVIVMLQCWTGYHLISSVVSIRRFFVDRNAQEFINTKMLLRHALAFGLYISTAIVYYTFLSIYLWTNSKKIYLIFAWVGIFYRIGSFISEMLLSQIFWGLGMKI